MKQSPLVFKIYGGLGNQMFQYAAAVALGQKFNLEIFFEDEYFHHPERFGSAWTYQLNLFNTRCNKWLGSSLGLKDKTYKLLKKLSLVRGISLQKYYFEKSLTFDKSFFKIKKPFFIDGYFQCEKYFSDIRSQLIQDFSLKTKPDSQNLALLEKISRTNAVSLHVRRGDYVSNAQALAVHGTCSLEYYQESVSLLKQKLKNPTFFIFSDDIAWAKVNLNLQAELFFVDINTGDRSYLDLHLMKNCKHHIIANSTFSWWAAWLNTNPEKLVICPRTWFKNGQPTDIYPPEWIRL